MINDRDVDQHVARQLRMLRLTMGMSQQEVADALSVRLQQIQKYETGINRISAGRAMQFAVAFNVSISTLFPESLDYQRHYEPIPPASVRLLRMINRIDPKHYSELHTLLKAVGKISTGAKV